MASDELDGDFAVLIEAMAAAWRSAPPPEAVYLEEVTRAGLAEVEAVAVVHGWMARLVRTAEATMLVVQGGYGEEASPLIRSMLEHAVGLWWLVDQRGVAFQALVRSRATEMSRLEKAQTLGWQVGGEEGQRLLREAIDIETDDDTKVVDRLLHVAHQAVQYGLGSFYQAWLVESWTSHASIASARAYYRHDVGLDGQADSVSLLLNGAAHGREVAAAVASAVHTGLTAYNRFLPGEPMAEDLAAWQSRFEQLAARLQEENNHS